MKLPQDVKLFAKEFKKNGFACFVVGGAVRNLFAGSGETDYDFATDAQPRDVQRIFHRVIPTGIQHGTVTVLFRGHSFEVTTFRVDGKYSDSRRPDSVTFTPSLIEDLNRRDFTINAIALDPGTGEIIDPHGGRQDIQSGIIKAIGNPIERFTEDGLRLLRACRFAASLEFRIDGDTLEGMRASAGNICTVSVERIQDEVDKIIVSRKPSIGFFVMEETSLLKHVFPELAECKGVTQKGFHDFDVLHHLFYSCDGAPNHDSVVRYAALFHDIGKPQTLVEDSSGFPTFYRHEIVSARIATKVMRRLKFPRQIEHDVEHLIQNHMFYYDDTWSDSAVRRFIARIGYENLSRLFALRLADVYGMRGVAQSSYMCEALERRIETQQVKENALTLRDLVVTGNDLHVSAGIPKGPIMGRTLEFLLETILDDPKLNTRRKLLQIAEKFYERYGQSKP